ncbi:Arsenical resistance operon trans-acting repressor ArsD [Eubacterium aggregans]|uniref:Arsenical resistance operon trans-acting repressor ArsD n=1 Tax=Eubacterium aggregans TaxID=81409 RepID=A0A1H4CGR3_9FIRM|nr:arsenite efflux transporter metallochaperone ArsD [Eubacterium aggregans]SEA59615.1 Arsenical resistance operon trans-acting repressor ArsD [Eubacterium aggregans]
MSKVEIFDPAMCCSTGVCGPGVDPELLRMATMVSNLVKLHKDVIRHNLSEEPQVYVDNAEVNTVLLNEGADSLPITLVDGEVYRKGSYPSNEELMEWTGTDRSEMAMAMLQEKLSKSSCCCGGDKGGDGGCCG